MFQETHHFNTTTIERPHTPLQSLAYRRNENYREIIYKFLLVQHSNVWVCFIWKKPDSAEHSNPCQADSLKLIIQGRKLQSFTPECES